MALHAQQDATGQPAVPPLAHEAGAEDACWARFAEARDSAAFCQSWLELLARGIAGARNAFLLLGESEQGPFVPAALWPDATRDMQYLAAIAERSLRERRGEVERAEGQGVRVAYPVEVSGRLRGVVVLDLASRSDDALQVVLRQLHWGSAWLEVLFRRQEAEQQRATLERLAAVVELAATAHYPGNFQSVAMALANELASRFGCQRVALGILRQGYSRLVALSHTAKFARKANLVRGIEAAMDEALDQRSLVVWPAAPEGRLMLTQAHERFARAQAAGALCTVPLNGRERPFGALMLERDGAHPFEASARELLEGLAALVGPSLEAHWRGERGALVRTWERAREQWQKLVGPGHLALKTVLVLALSGAIVLSVIQTEYRVRSKAVVEGAVQRSIAAPFDGFIARAPARAGDVVGQGAPLAELDDRDLKLERAKWASEREQLDRKLRQAMSGYDRAGMRIVAAQLEQAGAELNLVGEKLARARIVAPFDGVVVSGDLTQKLGAPVRQGDELFVLAPLDAFRLVLKVDEREVRHVREGQTGELIVSGMPAETLSFAVSKVTPVTIAEEGVNYFRIEARIDRPDPRMRPGMEGVGKIATGQRTLLWIWTHGLVDWLRVWAWSWWL